MIQLIQEMAKDWKNDYKNEVLECIEYNFNGDDFDELLEYLEQPNDSGELTNIADSRVDCSTYDLFDWAKDNTGEVNEYVRQFGINDKDFDITRLIQGAQFMEIEDELYGSCYDLKNYLETDEIRNKYPELFV